MSAVYSVLSTKQRKGFTLIELVIVVAIIALLSLLATMSYARIKSKSRLTRVSADLAGIARSVDQYAQDNNSQYPPDVDRSVPPGLEKYLAGGTWPVSIWPHGVFDWDNYTNDTDHSQVYQISYRLCGLDDPIEWCSDPSLFPNFTRYSSIFYCIAGTCTAHQYHQSDPAYAVNWKNHQVNY